MTIRRTKSYVKQYTKLPERVRKKVDKQLARLIQNIRHPSLNAKKMSGRNDIWEARVDIHHRMTFQFANDMIVLRQVGAHDVLRKP